MNVVTVATDETTGFTPGSIPRIGRGFRLQWEPVQKAHVLLYPEGMVKLNRTASEILSRCDGVKPVAAIVAELEELFDQTGLDADVVAFLDLAWTQRWVECT
ncbi:MAG: pyrroloquinoline quinone biosynthesis peptide chaperone PqqD [Rhodanobacter sp.]|nr:MAG: pyrroloquinoline quinone biosynthesis peptide chaperone PqqD [Rhodanobacter sp.]TAM43017.1 MAG: pyrroloquinoline quinone biosynthesis peptide chaperone PqqD [Rhodanobacter sp.]TAN28174.1 MAG: pyrroloquinoline quinone biosynthesis peptide chaperone PqqD [Rhodanobacter sp.]